MQLLRLGSLLFLAIAFLSGCRTSTPPPKEICILDGFGGGDCVESDGTQIYRTPSQMENYWSTNQADMAAFASWCYDVPSDSTQKVLNELRLGIINGRR